MAAARLDYDKGPYNTRYKDAYPEEYRKIEALYEQTSARTQDQLAIRDSIAQNIATNDGISLEAAYKKYDNIVQWRNDIAAIGGLTGAISVIKQIPKGVKESASSPVKPETPAKGGTQAETKPSSGAKNAAHNAASYAGLKMDLKTTESANTLVESLRKTGELPANYVNKEQAMASGWKAGKALNNSVPGGQIGGDVYKNTENLLPSAQGRVWREADVGLDNTMSRNNQNGTRLLYSNDGLMYITTDHYKSVTSIGTWK